MTKYALIVSAGAGDAIRDFYWNQQYASLEDMGPEDTCDIHITGINPFLHEFFSWHPLASQLTVKSYGYFVPDQEEELKRFHGIPLEGDYTPLPRSTKPVVFYPSPEDMSLLDTINDRRAEGNVSIFGGHRASGIPPTPLVVFSPIAGTPDRDLPEDVVKTLNDAVIEYGGWPIQVGRSFDRQGRCEKKMPVRTSVVDALSLPGVCKLVQGATGVVCCHSMVSMLCWLEKIPQLLLYPQEVYERHFKSVDMWSWGVSNGLTIHGTLDEFSVRGDEMIAEFLDLMKVSEK